MVIEAESGKEIALSVDYMLSLMSVYTGSRTSLKDALVYLSDGHIRRADAEKDYGTNGAGIRTASDGSFALSRTLPLAVKAPFHFRELRIRQFQFCEEHC